MADKKKSPVKELPSKAVPTKDAVKIKGGRKSGGTPVEY